MGLIKLEILLDSLVYYGGQILSGRLIVAVDEPMSMSAIYLKYSGKARVQWSERYRRNGESVTRHYSNEEFYLEAQQLIFGNGEEDSDLPEGEHVFVFNYQLPTDLPSSFEEENGRIRYYIKATIKRSWKTNHTRKQMLTIISVSDLNRHPFAAGPVTTQTSKNFFGHQRPLLMTVNLPIRGYVPGQIMPIKVALKNESAVQVGTICVTLEQDVILHATTISKTFKRNIFKNEFPVADGLGSEELALNLQLPALPPSNLDYCRIIDLSYQLKITARVKAWYHRSLSLRMDVVIGNIPVMSYQRPIPAYQLIRKSIDQGERSDGFPTDDRPPSYGFCVPSEIAYEDLPPPTYEKSMQIGTTENKNPDDRDDADSDGETSEYTPLYAVYRFERTQA